MEKTTNIHGTDGRSVTEGLPKFEIVRADGAILPVKFDTAAHAAEVAKEMFFYEEQDEERSGKGWDIQVVGADR